MRRREMLISAAATLAACVTARTPEAPARGLWRHGADVLAIGKFPEFGPSDFVFDYAAPRVGPIADTVRGYQMSSTLNGSGPPIAELIATGRTLRVGERNLRPVSIERARFTARSGDVALSGELATPRGARGSVLMIYGSGPAPKEAFDLWAFWFLAQGFAVITYDKRGSGSSSGDWRLAGLEQLAADARAVLATARERGAPTPVYAWGASQAGWIMPQLGAAGVLSGIVMHAGSAEHPRQQILSAVDAELRAYGFPPGEIERALAYYALDTDVSCGVRPWSEIDAAFRRASASGAEWLIAPPVAADAPERTMIRLMADFDPAPFWRANRAPTLALFGAKDWIVPAERNLRALQSMASGETLTVHVMPDANHLMFIAETGVTAEYAGLSRLAPDYFPIIDAWLDACT